jgi:hypothetical protein
MMRRERTKCGKAKNTPSILAHRKLLRLGGYGHTFTAIS